MVRIPFEFEVWAKMVLWAGEDGPYFLFPDKLEGEIRQSFSVSQGRALRFDALMQAANCFCRVFCTLHSVLRGLWFSFYSFGLFVFCVCKHF